MQTPSPSAVRSQEKESESESEPEPETSKRKQTQRNQSSSSAPTASPKPFINVIQLFAPLPSPLRTSLYLFAVGIPHGAGSGRLGLTFSHHSGVTITQSWTTASLLDSKVELADVVAPGAKVELQNLWNPSKASSASQKLNLHFKNPNVHGRAFLNYGTAKGNIDAVIDVIAGHEGFLVGGEAGYDVQTAALTKYSLGLGYQTPSYTASIVGTQNLSIIAASYYQKVNSTVEVGAKAGYDVQASKASGLELASKYKLDPLSFAKVNSPLVTVESSHELLLIYVSHRSRSTTAASPPSLTAPN